MTEKDDIENALWKERAEMNEHDDDIDQWEKFTQRIDKHLNDIAQAQIPIVNINSTNTLPVVQYKFSDEQLTITSIPMQDIAMQDIGLYQEWQKQANLAGSGNFPSFHEWLMLQVVSLRAEGENLRRKLSAARITACPVCWTNSWQPCEEDYSNALKDPTTSGWMFCGYCQLQAGYEQIRRELATEIEHYQKALDRAVAMEQGWDAAEERVGRLAETMTQLATELSNFETPLRDGNGYCPKHTVELAWGETCSGCLWDEINKTSEALQAALSAEKE